MLLAIDYGSTRTKIGRFKEGVLVETDVFQSPGSHLDLFKKIAKIHNGEEIGLALPGDVPINFPNQGVWRYGTLPRSTDKSVSGRDLEDVIEKLNLKTPRTIVNDATAAGFSIKTKKPTYLVQLSTGIAARAYARGRLHLNSKNDLSLKRLSQEEYQGKSFYHWLRREFRDEWISRDLVGLDWRELGQTDHQDIDLLATIFVSFIETALQKGPFKDPDIVLVGGGAIAIQDRLETELARRNLKASFGSELAGIYGIQEIYRCGFLPVISGGTTKK